MVEIFSIRNGGRSLIDANADYVQKADYEALATELTDLRMKLSFRNARIEELEKACAFNGQKYRSNSQKGKDCEHT